MKLLPETWQAKWIDPEPSHGPEPSHDAEAKRPASYLRRRFTAERIVGDAFFAGEAEKPQIPGFLVSHVVHCPRGAAPGCCPGEYGIDAEAIRRERGESP